MPADYKLRLGDGTILAVDAAGLRTWLIDDRAQVQPAGSRRWRPLREVVAQVQADADAEARRAAAARPPAPPPEPPAPEPPPPAPPPPAAPAVAPPVVPTPPAPTPPAPRPPAPTPPAATPASPPPAVATNALVLEETPFYMAPTAEAPVPAPPVVMPPPEAPPPAPRAAPPPPAAAARAVAPPVVTPPAPKPREKAPRATAVTPPARPPSVPAGPPLDLSEVARSALVTPIAEMTSPAPRQTSVRTPVPGEDLPVIPIRPLDDDARRERAAAKTHDDDGELEELQLVDAEEDPLIKATRRGQELLALAVAWVRRVSADVRARKLGQTGGSSPASAPAPRKPLDAPPSPNELPVLRFADEKEQAVGVRPPKRPPKLGKKGKLLIAGVAVGIVVVATGWAWIPALIEIGRRLTAPVEKKAAVPAPAASPLPPPPTLPPDVQAAVDQLPHLSLQTIQTVMKKSAYRPRDPAEIFSRAETAAMRGMSSLSEQEAQELSELRLAAVRALRPTDRQRVRGYERIRTGRELLSVSEDVRVLALFARGVRSLPPQKRERLQVLLGKAIVAELGPLPSPVP